MLKKFGWLATLLLMVALVGCAGSAPSETAAKADDNTGTMGIAEAVRPSFVRVEYTLQFDKGEAPHGSSLLERCPICGGEHGDIPEDATRDERPVVTSGILVAPNKVLTTEFLIHPRFVKSIHVRFGDQLVEATPAAFYKEQGATLLELTRDLKVAKPMVFDETRKGPYFAITYILCNGHWSFSVHPLNTSAALNDQKKFIAVANRGLIVDKTGTGVGANYRQELALDGGWKGSPLQWPAYSASEMAGLLKRFEQQAEASILRATIDFRSPRNNGAARSYREEENLATVQHALGIILDEKTALVWMDMKPAITARIDRIRVFPANGEPVTATFKATLKDYGALLITLEKPVGTPLAISTNDPLEQRQKLLLSASIRLQGEKRVAYYKPDRSAGFLPGFHQQQQAILVDFDRGSFVFDQDMKLVTLPLMRRLKGEERSGYDGQAMTSTTFTQVLANLTANADPSNVPLSEEQENRLAWMGVELQHLTPELARANNVADQTQDGTTGGLVTYVYPDSPAAKAGIEPGVVLVRIQPDGQPNPIEVQVEADPYSDRPFPWDKLDMLTEQYFDRIPAPWPAAENAFTRSLTDLGFGKKFVAVFSDNGKLINKPFEVMQSPAYYGSAARYKFVPLGLTVRDMTYEVRRQLQKKADDPGVVISKIEMGSKASIHGLKPFELITAVNDVPVNNVKDFERLMKGQ